MKLALIRLPSTGLKATSVSVVELYVTRNWACAAPVSATAARRNGSGDRQRFMM
jgi:hypothetical protein